MSHSSSNFAFRKNKNCFYEDSNTLKLEANIKELIYKHHKSERNKTKQADYLVKLSCWDKKFRVKKRKQNKIAKF